MANKVVLGQRPKFIRRAVEVRMPDGSIGTIVANYTYRTRTEYADYLDSLVAKAHAMLAEANAEPAEVPEPPAPKRGRGKAKAADPAAQAVQTIRNSIDTQIETAADQLLEILEGWDIDQPLNRASLIQLGNELPGAMRALVEGYRVAINEGHLGN